MRHIENGATEAAPFHSWLLRIAWLFLHAGIFLHRFSNDSGSYLRRVRRLRVGGGRADGSPCFATAKTDSYANKHC